MALDDDKPNPAVPYVLSSGIVQPATVPKCKHILKNVYVYILYTLTDNYEISNATIDFKTS